MAKDAVKKLEDTRQKLIKDLLEQREQIDTQLKALNYDDKKARA